MILANSVTTPKAQTQGKAYVYRLLHLDEIPDAMGKMGWKVAERLSRRWFAGTPAYVMTSDVRSGKFPATRLLPSQYDDQIVKMDWALSFPRCLSAFEDLIAHWNSPAGLDVLKERLKKQGWMPGKTTALGSTRMNARELDVLCQVNKREFGGTWDTIDDMYGALGNALFKLAVVGRAQPSMFGRRDIFCVDRIGIYIRDTYDFNDDVVMSEPLGIWNRDRILSKTEMLQFIGLSPAIAARTFQGFVPVNNGDFRRWQKANNSGVDFIVYSDVMWLDSPIKEELVWSHVKRTGVARRPLQKGEKLKEKISEQLTDIQDQPELVRSFFNAPSVAYIGDC